MNFQSSKKLSEIPKNIVETIEAINILLILTMVKNTCRHHRINFQGKYDVILIISTEGHVPGDF